jgi:dienelactone hydrolase
MLVSDFTHIGEDCASRNISCAIINYRLSPLEVPEGSEEHFKHPGHTEDCASALAYLYSHASEFYYDTNNVVIVGHSAGGFMAALLQFEDHFRNIWCIGGHGIGIRRIIGLQGIYDLPSILDDFGESYLKYMIAPAFGWQSKIHKEVSPKHIVLNMQGDIENKVKVPWTLIWSNKDTMVNKKQSKEFEEALKKRKIDVRHLVLEVEDSQAESASHHGITQSGFSTFVLPIVLEAFQS